jgi:hypothetical protein
MSIWANIVKRFKAPALPLPTREYDLNYFNQLLSVLRLYFNQLDNLLGEIVAAQPVNVQFYGSALDAFGRARFSQPFTLFDSQNRYAKNDDFDEALTGSGTVTYVTNESTVELNTTTASGDKVIRQTKRSFSYQPGKSLLTFNTFVMSAAQPDLRMRVGYFNDQNGVFFDRSGSTLYFVRRTYVSGAAVDTPVAQIDWNGDKLDGTGDSGLTLDVTKAQILWQDFEWLGVGSVRCGFVIDGQVIICHTFQNANNLTSVYMTTAILPLRYEVENVGSIASNAKLKQICSTVISEGGYEKKVNLNVARMTTANTGVTTSFIPLVSIRLASGRTGAVVLPDGYSALCSGTNGEFEIALFKNATLTGASFVTSDSANVEQDISATAMTGGTMIRNTYTSSGAQVDGSVDSPENYNWDLQIGATIGGTSDIYTLAVRTLSSTHSAIGSLSFWDLT